MNKQPFLILSPSLLPLHPLSVGLSLAFCVSPCIMLASLSCAFSPGISSFSSSDPASFSFCFFLRCPFFTHELSVTEAWRLLLCRLRAVILKRRDAARVHVSVCVCARLSAEQTGCFWLPYVTVTAVVYGRCSIPHPLSIIISTAIIMIIAPSFEFGGRGAQLS